MYKKEVFLTQEEQKELKDANLKAQVLVKKAVLNEMSKVRLTEEQLKKLNELKENLEMEFFLEVQAAKKIKIKDYEILELYKENVEKLKDANVIEVFPQLQQALYVQKLADGKREVINSIIEKYKLNDELKKYVVNLSEKNNTLEKVKKQEKEQ